LSGHTSFKIGGPADIIVFPESIDTVVKITSFCRRNRIPCSIVGKGTNLLVRDGGIRGVVLYLAGNINQMRRERNRVTAGTGALISDVARFACKNGLSGLEFSYGIPGSVGGAVSMNAGAYGREMKDVVLRTVFLDNRGNIGVLDAASHEFGYRKSCFQSGRSIILEVEFELEEKNTDEISKLMDGYMARRRNSQPLDMPSAGSVFKRPEGGFAGTMIEQCGLKGCRVGGAQVSEKHAGFIVNTGGATAADVLALISHIRKMVKGKFSVNLETEIKLIGQPGGDSNGV
jgi:UDP-N-acetylmuramate dehydrogenase